MHGQTDAKDFTSPIAASTLSTEHFIGQTQSKTSQFNSLNQEPSVADIINRSEKIQRNLTTAQTLQNMGVKSKPTHNRKRRAHELNAQQVHVSDYTYPETLVEFRAQLREAYDEGKTNARTTMERLPNAFSALLQSHGAWMRPFAYERFKYVPLVIEPPTYNLIHLDLPKSFDSEALNEESMDVTKESFVEPTHCKTCNVEANAVMEDITTADDRCGKKWRITRGTKTMNIRTALRLALGTRDFVNKDRSKRHRAPKYLPNLAPIPEHHDIVLHQSVFVKYNNTGELVFITTIEDEKGHRIRSTSSTSLSKFRGAKYTCSEDFSSIERDSMTRITPLTPVSKIEFSMDTRLSNEGKLVVTDEIQQLFIKLNSAHISEKQICVDQDCEYEVEDIIDKRINSCTHEVEFLTKFHGYSDSENQWLPQSSFSNFEYSSQTKSGRTTKQPQRLHDKGANDNCYNAYKI